MPATLVSEARPSVPLPSGTVTFLLTDIEGSTRLFRRLGDAYPPLLERHHALLREVWAEHGGAEFKSEGDALLVAFPSATSALRAAVEAQARLTAEPWPADARIRVRMGLHTGLAFARDGDYIALALHQAARVAGTGNGGQVVCSEATVTAADPIAGVVVERLGRYRLRDFDGPAELFQVRAAGASGTFPALRAVPAEGHNLSRQTDTFVGRTAELDELTTVVCPGAVVTILGLGGMGKTRLATELGLRVAIEWRDGAWMVDLSTIATGGLIAGAVGDALGVASDAEDPVGAIVEHLRDKELLLILDNCEHVLAPVRRLVDAVRSACPGVAILATSREVLAVRGERILALAPLPVSQECVELFIDRARQYDASFRLTPADADTVFEICRRLDGMPLAIELAAARVRVLAPGEILAGLERRLEFLRSRNPEVNERQRSLRGLLDWSYERLDEVEQAALRRLSVFIGSFDLVTAAAAIGRPPVDPADVDEVVWSLADKSLVHVERREGSTRYALLETVRAFAAEHSDEAGDAVTTRRALAEHAIIAFPSRLRGNRESRTRLARELATLTGLFDGLAIDGEAELAHTIGRLLVEFDIGTAASRGLAALERMITAVPAPSRALARLHLMAAKTASEQALLEQVIRHRDAARQLIGEFGNEDRWGPVLLSRVDVELALREPTADALAEAERALRGDLTRALPPDARADLLVELGMLQGWSDPVASLASLKEASVVAAGIDDQLLHASILNNLAEHELRSGNTVAAARAQQEAMRLGAELGIPLLAAFSLVLAARIIEERHRDAAAVAVRLHGAAEALLDEVGFSLYADDQELSDAMLDAARARIGPEAFDAERAAGRTMAMADAVALADEVFDSVISGV